MKTCPDCFVEISLADCFKFTVAAVLLGLQITMPFWNSREKVFLPNLF